MPPMESYPPLAQRDQGSTQPQDALGGFSTDGEGKAGVATGGLDSLSEYTLPGELSEKSKLRTQLNARTLRYETMHLPGLQ